MTTAGSANIGERAEAMIERQGWLAPLEERLQRAIGGAFAAAGGPGRRIKNLLHGTWLGHPLHPVLTDIPVGAWTAALVLDGLDARSRPRAYSGGADAAVAVGIAGAVAAAVPGITDWQHTSHGARRTGLVHGLLNTVTLLLYVRSLALRRGGQRPRARRAAVLGYGLMLASAYLGGSLVYRHRIGIDHSDPRRRPEPFVPVLSDGELPEGQPRRVEADGVRVVLVRRHGRVYALAETCSHFGGPLAEGRVEDGSLVCPWHGSRFALDDGRVLDGPSTYPQPCFETRVRAGHIEVRRAPETARPARVAAA